MINQPTIKDIWIVNAVQPEDHDYMETAYFESLREAEAYAKHRVAEWAGDELAPEALTISKYVTSFTAKVEPIVRQYYDKELITK